MRKIATALFFVSLSTFINQSGSANASEVMDPRQGEPVKNLLCQRDQRLERNCRGTPRGDRQ